MRGTYPGVGVRGGLLARACPAGASFGEIRYDVDMLLLLACVGGPVPELEETGAPVGPPDSMEDVPGGGDTGPVESGCDLVSDLADANFLESDAVSFQVRCSGTLATEDAVITARSLPAGASFDTSTLTFSWATGPAAGGRIDVSFDVVARGSADPVDPETITFWVADNPDLADHVPVDPLAYTEEWGLPVVHLATTGTLNTDGYQDVTVTWYGVAYASGAQVHGKTSSHYPKLSYGLKFDPEPLPIDPWGVSRDHLVLITPFDDNSYVRQKLTYDLWADLADYWGASRLAPRTFFTVVYLDGAYHGLYMAEDRVDDELADQQGFDRDANLYKAVEDSANFALTDAEGAEKATLHDGYEKKEGEPIDDFSDLDELVHFTGSSTPEELIAGSGAWFDLSEIMDAYLLLFYSNAEDCYTKNSYLHHAPGGLFRYIPWDFNASWGQNWRTYLVSSDFEDDGPRLNRVYTALLDVPDANAWTWARFDQARALGPFDPAWQTARLDGYYALIERSAQRDWDTWGPMYETYSEWADHRNEEGDWTDFEGERAYVYRWVQDRAAHFDAARGYREGPPGSP